MKRVGVALVVLGVIGVGWWWIARDTGSEGRPTRSTQDRQVGLVDAVAEGALGAHNDSVAILALGDRDPAAVKELRVQRQHYVDRACAASTELDGKVDLGQELRDFLDAECP